ncbi:MAG: ABC transporter permease [Chloroflexota bacterium]|nr:ABC transporter permease [Chloroflexota bacterium]
MTAADSTLDPASPGADGSAAPSTPARYGEVFDRGYKHYEGQRLGRGHAVWALVRYSMKRAMGIKKSWTAKIIPIVLYLAVTAIALIPIGIEAFLGDRFESSEEILPYNGFFGLIYGILGIFVATIAPEMLCGDRRENVLPLYFSRAITRLDYLLAKLGATALLTLTISIAPAFVLWLGRQLLAASPLTAMKENAGDLGRIAIAGVLIAFYLGAGGLMISSFTGRKSIAVAIIVIGFVVLESLVGVLSFALEGTAQRYVVFLSPTNTVAGLVVNLFEPSDTDPLLELGAWSYAAGMGVTILLACAVMYLRYVPDE